MPAMFEDVPRGDLMTPEERAKADDIWDKIDRAKTDASKERLWKRFDALVRQAVERRYPPMESI